MALFPNAKAVHDGNSGNNGLSVLSAKAAERQEKKKNKPQSTVWNDTVLLFTGTPEEKAERFLSPEFREDVAKYEEEGKSHTLASVLAGVKEQVERIKASSDGVDAVAEAIATDRETPAPSGSPKKSGASTAKDIVYSDWTPAAQMFGMDQSTAYAEHMANTAHQREVADLRAAGLNPVLGLGSGASGVSGNVAMSSTNGASGYSSAKKGIDSSTVDALAATANVIATLVSKKPYLGNSIGNAIKQIGRAFAD